MAALAVDAVSLMMQLWRRHYRSTACIHGVHDRCRKQCKFCDRMCRCRCHRQRRNPMQPIDPTGPDRPEPDVPIDPDDQPPPAPEPQPGPQARKPRPYA